MRISDQEKFLFIQYAKKHFGNQMHLYLFGSRIDDDKKGGDIDLFLDSKIDITMQQQINFIADSYQYITSRKLDLVVKSPNLENRPIYDTAKAEGILLC